MNQADLVSLPMSFVWEDALHLLLNLLEKSFNEELLCLFFSNTSALEVGEVIGVYWGGGGTVGTLHVVGEDFEGSASALSLTRRRGK